MSTENGTERAIDREDLARKIAALMAKADGTDSEKEKAVFAAKAQELLLKYNLTQSEVRDISARDEDPIVEEFVRYDQRQIVTWKSKLASMIAKNCFCRIYLTKSGPTFFGHKRDVESAAYLYRSLVVQLEVLAAKRTHQYVEEYTEEWGESPRWTSGESHPKVWRNSWLKGALSSIDSALWNQKQSFKASSPGANALVTTRDSEISKLFEDRTKEWGKHSYTQGDFNSEGYAQGIRDGKSIHAARGLEKPSTTTNKLLGG